MIRQLKEGYMVLLELHDTTYRSGIVTEVSDSHLTVSGLDRVSMLIWSSINQCFILRAEVPDIS